MLMMQRGPREQEERREEEECESQVRFLQHVTTLNIRMGEKVKCTSGENEEVFLNKFNYRAEKRGRYVVA